MDGTLIDSLMFWDHFWSEIGRRYMGDSAFRPTEEIDKRVRTMVYRDATACLHEHYRLSVPFDEFYAFAVDALRTFYRERATVKPGAFAILDYLREHGVRLCLASASAMDEIRFTLDHHGLLPYFDGVLSCADLGVGKDRPDIYLLAAKTLGLLPEEIFVFEDSFVALETAKAAGFHTVGLYDRYNFDQERLRASSEIYMDEHSDLASLIGAPGL